MASDRVVRVYQEDWWPFQNLPGALRRFSEATGIGTELSWDKVGVGSQVDVDYDRVFYGLAEDLEALDALVDERLLRLVHVLDRVLDSNDVFHSFGIDKFLN